MNIREKVREAVHRRRQAYKLTFSKEGVAQQAVLTDLARFCRAHKSTFHPNNLVAARLDGRREVWLRIQHMLNLSEDELAKYLGAKE